MYVLSHFRKFCSMARPSEHSLGREVFTSPPSIYGAEESAEWKRTRKGEVIMTVRMPLDAVDSEIYIKTPRGHSGISMDPWTSSTWSMKWSTYRTPNHSHKRQVQQIQQGKNPQAQQTYTRLLVDRNNTETATGLPGLT